MITALAWLLAAVLVALGLLGTVLPALPGSPLVLAGLLLIAWADGFERVGVPMLLLLGALTLLTLVVDVLAAALGARGLRASRLAMAGALVGTVAGIFAGLPGLLVGPFVGALAGEMLARRDLRQAGRAGLGAWIGLVLGGAAKLAIVFSMIGLFLGAYLF